MYESIPSYLKELDSWLCYDVRDRESFKGLSDVDINNERKRPRDLKGNVITNWTNKGYSFNECIESIKQGYNSGVGLVLKNNGVICIDYDNCIDRVEVNNDLGYIKPIFKSKELETSIMQDINKLKSYVELSPSNKGLHIVLLADIKDIYKQKPIEIYSHKKYIRFSGNGVFNFDLNYANNDLLEVIDKYNIDLSDAKQLRFNKSTINDFIQKNFKFSNGKSDNEILEIMFNSKNGDFLKRLYNNQISDNDYRTYKEQKMLINLNSGKISKSTYDRLLTNLDVSNSGKAYTLILYLFDFCYGDVKAVSRLFKKSALCRADYLNLNYKGNADNGKLYKIDKVDYMIKLAIVGKEHNRYHNYRR